MKWTAKQPNDSGWYWFRAKDVAPTMAHVVFLAGKIDIDIPELNFFDRPDKLTQFENSEWSDERIATPGCDNGREEDLKWRYHNDAVFRHFVEQIFADKLAAYDEHLTRE